jgi:hypothetical protein
MEVIYLILMHFHVSSHISYRCSGFTVKVNHILHKLKDYRKIGFQLYAFNVIMIECTLKLYSCTLESIILDNICDNIRKHRIITNNKTPNVRNKTYHLPLMTILRQNDSVYYIVRHALKKVFLIARLLQ